MNNTKETQLFSAKAATFTSDPMNVEGLKNIGLQLTGASISAGNGVFTVLGTIDGQNYVALNMIIDNVTNTNVQNLTRVASKTISSNSSILVFLKDVFLKAIKVKVTVTTDGSYSAVAIASK